MSRKRQKKITVGKSVSQELVKFGSVFRRTEDILLVVNSLSFTASLAKEQNDTKPEISDSCESESWEESKQTPLALSCLI